jgi:hypothetical protein
VKKAEELSKQLPAEVKAADAKKSK